MYQTVEETKRAKQIVKRRAELAQVARRWRIFRLGIDYWRFYRQFTNDDPFLLTEALEYTVDVRRERAMAALQGKDWWR